MLVCERLVVIEPGVAVMQVFVYLPEGLRGHNGDAELVCVEHHVGVVFKKRRIVGQSDRSREPQACQLVSDAEAVIFKIQPVGRDLARAFGKLAVHKADPVELRAVFIDAHGIFVIERHFLVKQLANGDAGVLFKLRLRLVRELILENEVSAFDAVF